MRWIVVLGLSVFLAGLCSAPGAYAQNWGAISGRITDAEDGSPLPGVTVLVRGTDYGTASTETGQYRLRLPAGRYALRFSAVGYQSRTDSVTVRSEATTRLDASLARSVLEMDGVTVEDERSREAGVYEMDPETVQRMPTPFKDGFRALKVVPGVATNNELSQQYSVRGGGYNENLIFINGFEVYMPFRPRQGEQEGLGLLNPDLAQRITFYTGGFPARYGGKLSSALDVDYGAPDRTVTGSAALSLLDASVHAGGTGLDDRLGWSLGVRKAQAQRFFSTQELKGDYDPDFTDVQALVRYQLTPVHAIEALGIWADHAFRLDPSNRKTYFGVLSRDPSVPSNLQAFWTQFDGTQRDGYTTRFGGVRLAHRFSPRLRVQHDVAAFETAESEFFNIQGQSELFQVDPGGDPDTGAGHFGIGASQQIDRADNTVTVNTLTGSGQYTLNVHRHALEGGWHVRRLAFEDDINEKSIIRARVTTASQERIRIVADSLVDRATLSASQVGAYVQDAIDVLPTRDRLIVTAGLRTDYYSFNGEWTVSPRLSARFLASEQLTLTGSWGLYHQKPTYRELRGKPEPGTSILDALNRDIAAQRSMQFVLGGEYFLPARRLYLRAEAYYKHLNRVISYDIENIRVEYSGENDARGYIYGLDMQVRGEMVPGLESWFNYSYMIARERFLPAYQTRFNRGLIPRPTDQRHTFSAFVQDYVPGDATWKLHLRALYGSGLPYTPPVPGPRQGPEGVVQIPGPRMAGRLSPYRRVDLGATKEIVVADEGLPHPIRLDLTLEVLNIFDMTNTVSYTWVPDGRNEWTRIPKRLTPRTLNVRVRVAF